MGVGEFFSKIEHREILDARYGGLVVGGSGKIDDIPMFRFEGRGVFGFVGLMHGWEFILSHRASALNMNRLKEINAEMAELQEPPSFSVSTRSMVLNCDMIDRSRGGLWVSNAGQFIVNAFATSKHFRELEDMNFEAGQSELD